MKKMPLSLPASRVLAASLLLALPVALWSARVGAAPSKRAAKTSMSAPLPRYVPMATIKKLQLERAKLQKQSRTNPLPVMQPVLWNGQPLKKPMHDLVNAPSFDVPPMPPATLVKGRKDKRGADLKRFAQVFPRPIPPARPRPLAPATVAVPVTPRWVRYPLEFQLAGIGIGTRAVDKDRFNRIDRYGLFALHGNPTAVVRATDIVAAGGGGVGGDGAAAPAGPDAAAPTSGGNVTLPQTPPELAPLFPSSQAGGGLPAWALAVTVQLNNNQVEWLYNRGTYSMGFVVDRLGFVEAVIVAGTSSDITQTQLEDPIHTVKLGDDLRKVLFRYGYPDDVVPLAADPAALAGNTTGTPGGAAATGVEGVNGAFRTYDLRYEQSYNVVFTIRNNRVVRVYIFGDPDFFNQQRRSQLRTGY